VGDLSDSARSVLDGYIREAELAQQLNRSVRTLQRLAARRLGPPRTRIGRLVIYNIEHVREWVAQQEQPRKPAGSVRHYARQLKRG
jgi:predicted DNA-binding transcriptional regulator AlpA